MENILLASEKPANLIVNFGGPRSLNEISPFLTELLCDQDVIRTRFPKWLHHWIFGRIAKKRSLKVSHDYEEIGGRSPIYFDTESIRASLAQKLQAPILTFHRYLPKTHEKSLEAIENCPSDTIRVFPMFPQFCYATTGSIARFFQLHLSTRSIRKLQWIKSYAGHHAFISAYQKRIGDFLKEQGLREEDSILLFSAHGIPASFVANGDPYESECKLSFSACLQAFPKILGKLSYQSKFGRGQWLTPATDETCEKILDWHEGRKNVILVPITFTSDHIETLFEIEKLYLPLIEKNGLRAYRCPALNLESYWIDSISTLLQETNLSTNSMLIRRQ